MLITFLRTPVVTPKKKKKNAAFCRGRVYRHKAQVKLSSRVSSLFDGVVCAEREDTATRVFVLLFLEAERRSFCRFVFSFHF